MEVSVIGDISEEEKQAYVQHALDTHPDREIAKLEIKLDGEFVDLAYHFADTPQPFQRIRRITGYLVGDMSHWNNAKRAEEADRIKHECGC
ncbi:MAG: hypothetical protein IIY02_01040 [Firmicutes bacterium]|nr:hypothetical protein [Bacillota bacterium]